ncbi:YoaK family protein [Sinomonas susongensis]|uniref:YoaK family protein n=1 Tax=Sinomonas susongensis TaxID=1324851 RepID=UPI0011086925|nr:YoaK family protein [Sinomonas susongensis]
MSNYLVEAWRTVVPERESRHGPLPPLLLLCTVVSGLVDAFSYLGLGHVFVANMTGNVVFLGFALAGTSGFQWPASLLAIVFFSLGAFLGGWIGHRFTHHRGRMALAAGAVQLVVVLAAFIVAVASRAPYPTASTVGLIVLLAFAMGLQNATARRLGVPDLTTTVLTMTLTGITADSRATGGEGSHAGRRLTSVLCMFVGALVGALLFAANLLPYSLLLATILLALVVLGGIITARSSRPWIASA